MNYKTAFHFVTDFVFDLLNNTVIDQEDEIIVLVIHLSDKKLVAAERNCGQETIEKVLNGVKESL